MLIRRVVAILVIFCIIFPPGAVFAAAASDALVSFALNYYHQGYYQEALHEFSKVLLIEPDNEQAKFYIQQINQKKAISEPRSRSDMVSDALDNFERAYQSGSQARYILINRELDNYSAVKKYGRQTPAVKTKKPEKTAKTGDYAAIHGDYQIAAGVRSKEDFIWKEANGDLNERNFRIIFSDARHNTFDPAIYDRIRLNVDTKNLDEIGLDNINAHLNVTIDPWSFTGRSEKFTIFGAGGDSAEFELKYWANTGLTINEIVPTLSNGDAMALPEIKVKDGVTDPTTVNTTFNNSFVIPSKKIIRQFMPIREFWLDFKNEPSKLRIFPIAYQDQALTTDDPLMLSNRHTWWEESSWLSEWKPGNLNTGASPNDFSKGVWDDSLAFFTRDSDNLRLTSLRGAAFAYNGVDVNLESTIASPKNIWADYGDFHTYASATRLKYDLSYNLGLGFNYVSHFGYNSDRLDGINNVLSIDAKHEPFMGTKLLGQVAGSGSSFDLTNKDFTSRKKGYAYLVSVENRFPAEDIYDKNFNAIKKDAGETAYLKSKLNLVRMDNGFESSLSSYRQTRDDEFWSRHISFRKHPLYLYTGLSTPMRFDDIKPFAIGNGIDSNRDVVSLRLEGQTKFFDRDLDALFDTRNVHDTAGGFIENVSRLELTYDINDKFITKFLGVRQNMPKTEAGFDPFIFDSTAGKKLVNTAILGGEDSTLGTVSFGFDYKASEQFSYNAVWEHTNDSTQATDNYPRGLFNSSSFTTSREYGKIYREPIPFLYSQSFFDMPPFQYFDIYKFGFSYRPVDVLEFYLDFTFNENKKAGQIDDNMNHYGMEIAYTPTRKLSFIFKYTYSRWLDMLHLNDTGIDVYNWHNNFFLQSRYNIAKDSEFIAEYGVGGITPLGSSTYDPLGGAFAVLDTQHIWRLYYKKKF